MTTASISKIAFSCPRCHAFADQRWYEFGAVEIYQGGNPASPSSQRDSLPILSLHRYTFAEGPELVYRSTQSSQGVQNAYLSSCASCRKASIWIADKLVYPESTTVHHVNPDTPPEIATDYNEAASILSRSPRGAAALLRLAIQKLCKHLGEPGRNINDDIASLVKNGLDVRIQKALDVLRVVGNEAVHPGKLDLNDDRDTAESLFKFFNLIVEKMISEPKHVDEVYALIPPDKLKAIEARDKEKGNN